MSELIKEARKDARSVYKNLPKFMRKIMSWATNSEVIEKAKEKTKDRLLQPIRDSLYCYTDDECNLWWKAFYSEYDRLEREGKVLE